MLIDTCWFGDERIVMLAVSGEQKQRNPKGSEGRKRVKKHVGCKKAEIYRYEAITLRKTKKSPLKMDG